MSDEEEDVIDGGDRVSKRRQRNSTTFHAGVAWTGIVLVSFLVYSLHSGMWEFAFYNAILLVVLVLGSKSIN